MVLDLWDQDNPCWDTILGDQYHMIWDELHQQTNGSAADMAARRSSVIQSTVFKSRGTHKECTKYSNEVNRGRTSITLD